MNNETFLDDLKNALSDHVSDIAEKLNDNQCLTESQVMYFNRLKTSELKISYLLDTCILPKAQSSHSRVFEILIEYMKNSGDPNLSALAEKILEERTVPTVTSQEATDSVYNGDICPITPTQDTHSQSTVKSHQFKNEELVASNGSIHQSLEDLNRLSSKKLDDANNSDNDLLISRYLEKVLQNNILFKVQVSVVTCTGIPKTGKTSFSHLLIKNQSCSLTNFPGDHATVYVKKENNSLPSKGNVKWEKIELNKLIDQFKNYMNYIQNRAEYPVKMTRTSSSQALKAEIERIKNETWSILIMLDVSVPTLATDLLPPSIVTFVTCRLCDQKDLSIENLEFPCFLNALMSGNCFKTNPKRKNAFDKLMVHNSKSKKQCYTAFVGVYKTKIPKDIAATVNQQLLNLHEKLVQMGNPQQGYPYWRVDEGLVPDVDEGLLHSINIENPNDPLVEHLFSQMENLLSQSIVYNIPINWLLLYFKILKRCEEKEFVHYKTILDLEWRSMSSNNDEDGLKIALSFFHHQGALLYFKDVDCISDYIFKDIRWLFRKITYLLYQLPPTYYDYDASIAFKHEGILNEQKIFELTSKCDKKDDIPLCDFLKLLVHKKFIFPLNRSESTEYFIPAVLKSFDLETEKLSKFASFEIKADSLLVVFRCGSLHRLLFYQLAAYLLKTLPPKWSRPGPNNKNEQNIFSNLITFPIDGIGHVSFIDRIHFLEIQICNSQEEASSSEQLLVRQYADRALYNACVELQLDYYELKFGFLCQDCSNNKEHIMVIDKDSSVACCCVTNKRIKLRDYHLKWINESSERTPMQEFPSVSTTETESQTLLHYPKEVTMPSELEESDGAGTSKDVITLLTAKEAGQLYGHLKSRPTLRQLHWFKGNIGHRWYDLGVDLLNDSDTNKLETIRKDHPNDNEKCCSQMFQLWLNNTTGPGVSWDNLINSLKRIKMAKVAQEVLEYLHGGRMMTQDFYSAPADDYFTGYHQYGYTQGNPGYLVATSSGNQKKHKPKQPYKTAPVESYSQQEKQVYGPLPTVREGTTNRGRTYEASTDRKINSLQRFSVQITQRVDPSLILPHLLGKGLVTSVQVENLSDKNQISSAKKEYLLCNVLIRLSEKNVNKFVECLKETSDYDPHNELLRIINNGRQVAADE